MEIIITKRQGEALEMLRQILPTSKNPMKDLQERLGVSHSVAYQHVEALIDVGLVERLGRRRMALVDNSGSILVVKNNKPSIKKGHKYGESRPGRFKKS